MKLQWSLFNYACENPSTHNMDIYNTRTKGIISIDKESYDILSNYLAEDNLATLPDEIKKGIAQLYRDGYIASAEEWDSFVQQREKGYTQLSRKFLFYYIPSWECNFRCTYCHFYENIDSTHKIGKGDVKETAEYLINYLKSLYAGSAEDVELTVVLYGGEPLLKNAENEAFLAALFALSQDLEFKLKIALSIITNGYLFDENAYQLYSKYNLKGVQITLDGERDFHNKKRFHVGEVKETFDIILQNLQKAVHYDQLHITLRINVDEDNMDNIPQLLQHLRTEGLTQNVSLSISPVFSNVNVEGAIQKKNVLQQYKAIFKAASDLNFSFTYPTTSCSVYSKEFLSMAFGKAYPCPSMCGRDLQRIGDLTMPVELASERYTALDEMCFGCKWAPLCGSGCAYQNIKKGKTICLRNMYQLMIEAYVLHYNAMNRYIGG